jgi:hypothetical protein
MYMDSLGVRYNLKVEGGAAASLRDAVADRTGAVRSSRTLATYDGGALTVAGFMRWAAALPPSWGSQVLEQPDSALTAFVRIIGQNELLLREAERARIGPTPTEWAGMYQSYRAQLDTLRMNLGLSASDLSDPAASGDDRVRVAAMKIESFWDKLAAGGARPRPIPPQLAYVLRQGAEFSVDRAGIARAVELAKSIEEQKKAAPPPPPSATPDSAKASSKGQGN